MPRLEGLRVARSSVHGYGVYATRSFRAGEIIVHADGVVWTEDEVDDDTYALVLPSFRVDEAGFVHEDGPDIYYDLVDQTRWINHSCAPNCEADEAGGRIFIRTIRKIKAGEELNYDYGLVIDEKYTPELLAEYPCHCGAVACRGTLLSPKD